MRRHSSSPISKNGVAIDAAEIVEHGSQRRFQIGFERHVGHVAFSSFKSTIFVAGVAMVKPSSLRVHFSFAEKPSG